MPERRRRPTPREPARCESLRRTLRALQDDGLVARNPATAIRCGPSTVFTTRGAPLGPRARRLLETLRGHEEIGLKTWSLPVLAALAEPRRFSELGAALPEATPRALTLALKDLRAAGLVRRTVTDDYPPAVVYELTRVARPIAAAAQRL